MIFAQNQPFDGKAGDSRLLCQHISSDLLEDRLRWRIRIELFRVIFVVDIVANSHKLSTIIGTCKKDDGDSKDFGVWDSVGVRRVGFEEEFVDTDGYWADKKGVKLLIVLVPEYC